MLKNFHIVFLFLLAFISVTGKAQKDTLQLQPVEIKGDMIEKISGFKKTSIGSLTRNINLDEDLSTVLARHSPVFIKSYGQGMLATSSFRGTASSHTQVMWNGMTINSPMLGQVDFSSLPVFFTDHITLYHGGSSISLNSGALGGSIVMRNNPHWKEASKVTFSHRQGSFNTQSTLMGIRIKKPGFLSNTRLMYKSSSNDFPFRNIAVSRVEPPLEYRKNAAYANAGLMQEVYIKTKKLGTVSFKTWWQENSREIPTPLLVTPFEQNQDARNFRSLLEWNSRRNPLEWRLRSGYQNNKLNYYNGLINTTSINQINSFFGDTEVIKRLGDFKFNALLRHDYHYAEAKNYDKIQTRSQSAIGAGMQYFCNSRFSAFFQLRQEYADREILPLIPSLGFDYLIWRRANMFFKANASKNFHLPSLNDLYWSPNGNPELSPEKGYAGEVGVMVKNLKINWLQIQSEITAFYSVINDWIQWKPDEIYSYWRPSNLKKVKSSGVETSIRVRFKTGKLKIRYNGGYTYTATRNTKGSVKNDASVGKQLLYIPRHMHHSALKFLFGRCYASLGIHYTGKRYTATDNSRYMTSYWLTDVALGWKPGVGSNTFIFQVDINNILDANYQAVAWHPMPGRNIHFKLAYIFKANDKTKTAD